MSVYQHHHISYRPEIIVYIRKGVHDICSRIMRHSRGMSKEEKRAILAAVYMIPDCENEKEKEND